MNRIKIKKNKKEMVWCIVISNYLMRLVVSVNLNAVVKDQLLFLLVSQVRADDIEDKISDEWV